MIHVHIVPRHCHCADIAVITAVPLATILGSLAVALVMVLAVRRRAQHRTLLGGAVLPPGPGPATTLVVTAIAQWHSLWEEVDADVMEAAVKVHDTIIRAAAARHGGYESSTLGESWGGLGEWVLDSGPAAKQNANHVLMNGTGLLVFGWYHERNGLRILTSGMYVASLPVSFVDTHLILRNDDSIALRGITSGSYMYMYGTI